MNKATLRATHRRQALEARSARTRTIRRAREREQKRRDVHERARKRFADRYPGFIRFLKEVRNLPPGVIVALDSKTEPADDGRGDDGDAF